MQKINNPFKDLDGYNCFGCAPHNSHGLRLEFYLDDDNTVVAYWNPKDYLQGYFNVLHGGIQATLLDEIAGWVVNVLLETGGVTSRLDIRYRKPVLVTDSKITLRAKLVNAEKRLADIKCELYNSDGELCAEANAQYFTYPPEIAKKKLNYPGIDKFINKK